MTTATHPYERIDLRTSPDIKDMIVRAAAAAGVSVSAFLISSAQERAKTILQQSEALTLSPRDWEAFFVGLDAQDKPRPRLEQAAKAHANWRKRTA
jgi:uncharacterized protein (DUF1778 family)